MELHLRQLLREGKSVVSCWNELLYHHVKSIRSQMTLNHRAHSHVLISMITFTLVEMICFSSWRISDCTSNLKR